MTWRREDPEGNEAAKIRHLIVPWTTGKGLDVGCGPWKAWPRMIGVDTMGEWREYHYRPDIEADGTDLPMFADGSLDFVFSSHFLEHVEDAAGCLREWWRVLKDGGRLVLYLPHKDHFPRMGEDGSNPDHRHDFDETDIIDMMTDIAQGPGMGGWDLAYCEVRTGGSEYSFLMCFVRTPGETQTRSMSLMLPPRGTKTAIVVRYGAIGDCLMAGSVTRALKAEGYHVTLNTNPTGRDVLRDDPSIDRFWVQETDQVPDRDLPEYWSRLLDLYDHAVNLSESVEGLLLAVPGRRDHALPKTVLHKLKNFNYLETMHEIAGVPHRPDVRFYADAAEQRWARRQHRGFGGDFVIQFPLAGSSVHKLYPNTDHLIVWALENWPDAVCVTTGDGVAGIVDTVICQKILHDRCGVSYEASHEMTTDEQARIICETYGKRFFPRAGHWSVRETLAFIQTVDMLVGPETGMMNAASCLPSAKVCLLSHSTDENLTRDWVNTIPVHALGVGCYPCHRMHYTRQFCPVDERTGAALCQAQIPPETVFAAMQKLRVQRKLDDFQGAAQ